MKPDYILLSFQTPRRPLALNMAALCHSKRLWTSYWRHSSLYWAFVYTSQSYETVVQGNSKDYFLYWSAVAITKIPTSRP